MKVLITYFVTENEREIDLSDMGFDEETKWEDLTPEEQIEIKDACMEGVHAYCCGQDVEED